MERQLPHGVRRMRPGDLGTSTGTGDAFDRQGVLRRASGMGVSREDRARLETLARFAFASPDFRAVTTVRLDDGGRTVRFEVCREGDGVVVRPAVEPADEPALPVPAPTAAAAAAGAPTGPMSASPAGRGGIDRARAFEEVAEQTPDLMATFAPPSWQISWANPALRDGLHVPTWATPLLVELMDESSQGHFVVKILPELLSRGWWHGQMSLIGPDSDPIVTSSTLVAVRGGGGEITALALSAQRARPVTAEPRPSRHDQLADFVEHVSDLIAVVDQAGSIRYASPAAAGMLGYGEGELAATSFAELLHPDDEGRDIQSLVRVDPDGTGAPVSFRLRAADGTWRHLEAVVSDLTANASIGGFVVNARDVTERVTAYSELTEIVYSDRDTGLPNRLRLLDRLTNLLEADPGGGTAVVLLDVDGFRQVNEAHGVGVGDELLKQIAHRLVDTAGAGGMVARLRSDEFAVLLSEVDEEGVAVRAADALRIMLSHPFELEAGTIRLGASVGVVVSGPGDGADELLSRADHAAGLAKKAGGNRTQLWSSDAARADQRRRAVEHHLRTVVEHGVPPVHYQPIVSVAGGEVSGAEALLRVRDGIGELLNPAEFVDAAESSGLISRLGGQILRVTCEQLSLWDAQLRNLAPDFVSVNVSPRQLIDPGLVTQVIAALEASAIQPHRLRLELTESTVVNQDQIIGDRVAFLRDVGVQVGLDEFGAGYSTLNYMKRFQIDFVKIDRSLIAGLGVDERDTAIVRATVQLAHSLGISAIAVGVETDQQLAVLRELDCDSAQGYLFAPPRAAPDFADAVKRSVSTR